MLLLFIDVLSVIYCTCLLYSQWCYLFLKTLVCTAILFSTEMISLCAASFIAKYQLEYGVDHYLSCLQMTTTISLINS